MICTQVLCLVLELVPVGPTKGPRHFLYSSEKLCSIHTCKNPGHTHELAKQKRAEGIFSEGNTARAEPQIALALDVTSLPRPQTSVCFQRLCLRYAVLLLTVDGTDCPETTPQRAVLSPLPVSAIQSSSWCGFSLTPGRADQGWVPQSRGCWSSGMRLRGNFTFFEEFCSFFQKDFVPGSFPKEKQKQFRTIQRLWWVQEPWPAVINHAETLYHLS